ncbi:hypothetical protein Tco_1500446 [Tanacetum coccineum]
MPGFIQVSVLEFKELPSSSNSVKVSLGKVEHEAEEKGTYSFPLTNMRDNLIITIQDSEGNQVSHSGVRTMSIIEKGTWDDLFPIEGGGLIHMKLQFVLSDEERNRIRLMRETAMKKKQAEILSKYSASLPSRHEVSDVLRATSSKDIQISGSNNDVNNTSACASVSSDVIKEEFLQRLTFTNATDIREQTSFSQKMEGIEQKAMAKANSSGNLVERLSDQNLVEKMPADIKSTSEDSASLVQATNVDSNKSNETPLQQAQVPEKLLQDIKTHHFEKNDAAGSKPSGNLDEKLDKQNLEEKIPSYVKNMSKVTKVHIDKDIEIQSQQAEVSKRLKNASSGDVNFARSTIAEKVKSLSPSLAGEPVKRSSLEKTPRNIKKMISVFESSMSQDRVPLKPLSTKSYRAASLRLLKNTTVKDYYDGSESSQDKLEDSETSSSTRLRNSFSTGDLRKSLSSIIKNEEQASFDSDFVEPSETNGSIVGVNNEEKADVMVTDTKNSRKSCDEETTVSGRLPPDHIKYTEKDDVDGKNTSKYSLEYFDHEGSSPWTFLDEKRHFCITAHGERRMSFISNCKIPETVVKGDGIVEQGEETVRVSGKSSPKDEEASNGLLGQAIKIALVVGFGVLVLLFRQREPRRAEKKDNARALKNQVFMNKQRSAEEQRRRIVVMKSS